MKKISAIAYRRPSRIAAALLVALSRGGLLVLVAVFLFVPSARLTNQLRLMRAFAWVVLVPAIAAELWKRACAVTASIEGGALVLERRGLRIEIPCDAIDRVVPWIIPLPASGVGLRLKSGRRFQYGLHVDDPVGLIESVANAGAPEHVQAATRHPAVAYARAKSRWLPRWYHGVLKFPVFALVPTLPIFRLNQWIVYGGTFGEYYMYGLRAYLLGFVLYWGAFTIYLVLYAAVLRTVAETIALPAAWLAPARAATVRAAVEIGAGILYYAAVPAALLRLWVLSR